MQKISGQFISEPRTRLRSAAMLPRAPAARDARIRANGHLLAAFGQGKAMTKPIGRRELITLLGGVAAAPVVLWPRAARAQRPDRVRRVGVLMAMTAEDPEGGRGVAALEQGLRELLWHPGRNIHVDYRWAADDPHRLRREAAALVAASPELILANSTPVLAALRQERTKLPTGSAQ